MSTDEADDANQPEAPQRRQLTDAKEMRALAHPVRVALLELLTRDGPMTATEAGEALGESPANTSFHLRTLAKYGFVEEAPGGTGRQRPWQRVGLGNAFDLDSEDVATAAAAKGLADQFAQRTFERRREWELTRPSYDKAWRDADFTYDAMTYLTPAELAGLGAEIRRLVDRYIERLTDRTMRPDDAGPVAFSATGYPIPPTARGN
jgi:DNA-binding transcriptional ArsR family regulator